MRSSLGSARRAGRTGDTKLCRFLRRSDTRAATKAGRSRNVSNCLLLAKLATLVEASWLRLACVAPACVRVMAAAEDAAGHKRRRARRSIDDARCWRTAAARVGGQ